MRIKLQHLTEHIHGFLLVLGLTALLASAIYPSEYLYYFFHSFVLLIPFCITLLAVSRVKHFICYFLLGMASAAAAFLLGSDFIESLYLVILAVLILLIRIPPRLNNLPGLLAQPSPGFLGYFVCLFFVSLITKLNQLQNLVYWLTFVYLLNFIIYTNVKSLNDYLYSRKETANLPGRQICSTNRGLVTIFSVLMVLAMLALPLLPADKAIYSVGIALRDFLRWLFSHFSEEPIPIAEMETEELIAETQSNLLPDTSTTPAWLTMLYNILFGAITFIVCTAVIIGIIYLIYLFIQRFYRPVSAAGDTQEFIDKETEPEYMDRTERQKKEGIMSRLFNPNAIVRKRFKRRIKKGAAARPGERSGKIPAPLTPSELEEFAGLPADAETQKLHELYEKARYSRDGCTKEEASSLK